MGKSQALDASILVIGATDGLGFATLNSLVQKGYTSLYFTSRSQEKIKQTKQKLNDKQNQKVTGVVFDQSDKASIEKLFTFFQQHENFPEIIFCTVGVNCAHTQGFKKLHSLSYERLQSTIGTNITHTLYLLSLFLPELKKQTNPQLVLIGSKAYEHGIKGQIAYNTSKAAMLGMHNTLCQEYPKITSHLFEPGIIDNARVAQYKENLESFGIGLETEQDTVERLFKQMGWL